MQGDKKKSWEEPAKSRKMDLTSNKEKLTTATGICTKTENEKARGEEREGSGRDGER